MIEPPGAWMFQKKKASPAPEETPSWDVTPAFGGVCEILELERRLSEEIDRRQASEALAASARKENMTLLAELESLRKAEELRKTQHENELQSALDLLGRERKRRELAESKCQELSVEKNKEIEDFGQQTDFDVEGESKIMGYEDERTHMIAEIVEHRRVEAERRVSLRARLTGTIAAELKSHCDLREKVRSSQDAERARQTTHRERRRRLRHKTEQPLPLISQTEQTRDAPLIIPPGHYVVGKTALERRRMMYHVPGCTHLSPPQTQSGCSGSDQRKKKKPPFLFYPMTVDQIRYMEHRPCPWCEPTPIGVLHHSLLT